MVGAGTDSTKPAMTGGPAIVLVRPQLAVNVGMCARAMANFGLSDLRLVAPSADLARGDARAAAAGALAIFEGARVVPTLAEAVADAQFVWATTARERGQGKRVEGPGPAMAETAARIGQGERHVVLFGPERTGLDNDEVAVADAILTFPVNPAYASLNLAQAVLLTGYEWFRATHGEAPPFTLVERSPPAPRAVVLSFFDYLDEELVRCGFYRPEGKQPVMSRNLRNIFHRLAMSEQDVRTLRGMVVRLVEGQRTFVQTRRRVRQPKHRPKGSDTPGG